MAVVQHEQAGPSLAPVAGLASAIAMGVYIGYSMSKPSNFRSSQQRYRSEASYSNNASNLNNNINNADYCNASTKIRNRIFKTYAYFAGSIGLTGLSAYFCFNFTKHSQHALVQMNKHPKWYLFTSLISSLALLFATKCTNYKKRPILKHLLWIAMHVNEGALLSVLGFIGGPIIIKAAIYTAAILGGISLMSASASDEKILK
eukprot:UN07668